jgi:hypothetical protein
MTELERRSRQFDGEYRVFWDYSQCHIVLREQIFNVLGIFHDSIKPIRKCAAGIRRSLSRKCRKHDRCSWNVTARGDEEAVEIF